MSITEQKFRELLDKYLAGQASEQEKKLLNQWFESYKDEALEAADPVAPEIQHQIKHHIDARVQFPTRNRQRYPVYGGWAAAASLLIIMAVWFLIATPEASENVRGHNAAVAMMSRTVPKGKKLLVNLPDGTQVKLNAQSTLRFPKTWDKGSREVYLEGEAFFDVAHNPSKPFRVTAGLVKTTVLGTAFNIKAVAGSDTEITLVHGKVNVQAWTDDNDSSQVLLHPNEQAVIAGNSVDIVKHNVSVEKYIAWKNNVLYFDHTSLREAVSILESWYDQDIKLENPALGNCIINAKYKNEPLDNVLQSLHFLLNLSYEKQNGVILLKGAGCRARI